MARVKNIKNWLFLTCKMCQQTFETRKSKPKIYCSKKCSNNDPTIKEKIVTSQKKTYLEKYDGHPMKTDETKNKLKQSLISKYGVSHYSNHTEYRNKVKSTLLKKRAKARFFYFFLNSILSLL
jgi:hypothetical protein